MIEKRKEKGAYARNVKDHSEMVRRRVSAGSAGLNEPGRQADVSEADLMGDDGSDFRRMCGEWHNALCSSTYGPHAQGGLSARTESAQRCRKDGPYRHGASSAPRDTRRG
jgi:hypothetical protein